ncbi:P-loop containing nucleoside triphosphate hydrolase protein, partial [Thamnocephalis sphaerospora]
SGKSSLCMAALRELRPLAGSVKTLVRPSHADGQMRIAYLSQSPWIIAGTVLENILFGEPYDPVWFTKVVEACALAADLAALPHAERTFIGERGITLSGGQRARVALARAVYMRADLYILDDPLSAVDPRVARHLFEQVLCGVLDDRPRILVTHQLQFVRHCDRVLVLENGRVAALDRPDVVLSTSSKTSPMTDDGNSSDGKHTSTGFLAELREYAYLPDDVDIDLESGAPNIAAKRTCLDEEEESYAEAAADDDSGTVEPVAASEEDQAYGQTPLSTYWRFFRFGAAAPVVILMMLLMVAGQGVMVYSDWWLAQWTNTPAAQQTDWYRGHVYIALVAVTFALSLSRASVFFWLMLNASRWAFRSMLQTILMVPIQFFHTNPHGRVLNRFSKDQSNVDELLPMTFFDAAQCMFIVVGAIVIVCIVNPYVAITLPVILGGFLILRWLYMNASRQVKRIESVTRSPVYSQLSETLYGLVTVRAHNMQTRFWDRFAAAQNTNASAFFAFLGCARWVGFRLDMCSSAFLIITAFASVAMRDTQQASLVGLSLSYVLQLIDMLQWAVRQSIEVEMQFISVERIIAYTKLESEPPRHTDTKPPANWPDCGAIEFRDMSLTYPGTSSPVLKNITLSINPGEKIGVVGRTGAGKSSLLTALFRLTESSPTGCIVIDGIPISNLGVHDLRSRLAIIPQAPVLFKGSLRFNLDPFQEYSDVELWQALQSAELKESVERMPHKLDTEVAENGRNFSAGEQQLISLCRAILRNARVVVMDEATANVDLATDRRIQRAIREQFHDATVLTIAHRLDTVV